MQNIDLNQLFDIESITVTEIVVKQKPSRLDPLADLMTGNVSINFTPRHGKTTIPFMDFSKGDRRWLDYLVEELMTLPDVFRADKIIMLGYSSARKGSGSKQTWLEYIRGLHEDKVVNRRDYSTSQLKHLPTLIAELSAGNRLNGCGSLEFHNLATGKTL
ncbi:hypothetical protein ACTOV4_02765 [Brucella sp. C7-11G]